VNRGGDVARICFGGRSRFLAGALCPLLACGCGAANSGVLRGAALADRSGHGREFAAALASSRRAGRTASFRPRPWNLSAQPGAQVHTLDCRKHEPLDALAHIELFAENHVVIVPAGIGVSPPLRIRAGRIVGERCSYALRTLEPTGLLLLGGSRHYTVGELFELWGEPLTASELAGFRAGARERVSVFIDGTRWRGSPSDAPLSPGSQVTLEVGPFVPPHARYLFPPRSSLGP